MLSNEESILAVHSGALGDVILLGRLLERLGRRITLVAGGEKARLLVKLGVVATALDFQSLPMHEIFADTPLAECRLPGLMGAHDRLVSCFAAGDRRAEMRLAAACGCGDAAFLPIRPPDGCTAHLVELWEDMLGLSPREPKPAAAPFSGVACSLANSACEQGTQQPGFPASRYEAWPVPGELIDAAQVELARAGLAVGRFVAIHPGSGGVAKCWPIGRFLELAEKLETTSVTCSPACDAGEQGTRWVRSDAVRRCFPMPLRAHCEPVFILGPAELERWGGEVSKDIRQRFPVLAAPELTTLAGVLKLAAFYVGNDSGVTHLAAAVGTPTLALFGPSRPEHFAPLGPRVRIVAGRSMEDISIADVLAAARPMLVNRL